MLLLKIQKMMKNNSISFQFLCGEFTIQQDSIPESSLVQLQKLSSVQSQLLEILPFRKNEISQFTMQCILDLMRPRPVMDSK